MDSMNKIRKMGMESFVGQVAPFIKETILVMTGMVMVKCTS